MASDWNPVPFRVHRYRAADDQLQPECGYGPPGKPSQDVDDPVMDEGGDYDLWIPTRDGGIELLANSGPPPKPSPPSDKAETVRCKLCAGNDFLHCDAVVDPSDTTRSLSCTRCSRWGLICTTSQGVELPIDEHAAGTGPADDLIFPGCLRCSSSQKGCDRYASQLR